MLEVGAVQVEVPEGIDAVIGEEFLGLRTLDDQFVHVMGLVEEHRGFAPRALLVAPVGEFRGDDRIDIHADLAVPQHLHGGFVLGDDVGQAGHKRSPSGRRDKGEARHAFGKMRMGFGEKGEVFAGKPGVFAGQSFGPRAFTVADRFDDGSVLRLCPGQRGEEIGDELLFAEKGVWRREREAGDTADLFFDQRAAGQAGEDVVEGGVQPGVAVEVDAPGPAAR